MPENGWQTNLLSHFPRGKSIIAGPYQRFKMDDGGIAPNVYDAEKHSEQPDFNISISSENLYSIISATGQTLQIFRPSQSQAPMHIHSSLPSLSISSSTRKQLYNKIPFSTLSNCFGLKLQIQEDEALTSALGKSLTAARSDSCSKSDQEGSLLVNLQLATLLGDQPIIPHESWK
ncbi:hypothetical protein BDZ45DRAFT_753063 [Acephala macrosclerotiorum]|nr:hypothetical protein BDZ45DRAFT_753063 [Acephala macrosclerotiorum]